VSQGKVAHARFASRGRRGRDSRPARACGRWRAHRFAARVFPLPAVARERARRVRAPSRRARGVGPDRQGIV